MFKDIATLISDKSVDPNSKRPYPVTMIEKAMSDAHYSVHTGKSAKQQCAEVLKLLQTVMPIEAAKLRINCCLPSRDAKRIKASIIALTEEVTDESYTGDEYEMPGKFRLLNTLVQDETKGRGSVQVLTVAEVAGDELFE